MNNYGLEGKSKDVNRLTLKEVDVTSNICGEYAEFTIKQSYENETEEDLEGFYSFPVPEESVLSGIEISLGGRNIRGRVDNKEEALKVYVQAEENKDDIFTLEDIENKGYRIGLGKILSGESVSISVSYIEDLVYEDNRLKLTIPALIKKQEKDYDKNLSIIVESLNYANFESTSHKIKVERDEELSKITLHEEENSMDKDFVLYIEEEELLEASGIVYENFQDDTALLYLRFIPQIEEDVDIIKDVKFNFGNVEVEKTYPRTIDYMYVDKAFTVFAKIRGKAEGVITFTAMAGDTRIQRKVILNNLFLSENVDLLEKVWYKNRIESLEERIDSKDDNIKEAMRRKIAELSRDCNILSSETGLILFEEFEEPILGASIRRILPLKYIRKE